MTESQNPDADYELKERESILATDNDVGMHPKYIKNKAAKEIRERISWPEYKKPKGIK